MPLSSRDRISHAAGWFFVAAFLLSAGGCRKAPSAERPPTDAGWTLAVEPISSPASGTTAAPQLTVRGDRAILSWLETADARTTLKFAERTASQWSEPRVVASGSDFVTNAADVPSVRALADGTLAAHWNRQYGDDPEAYSLQLSWSKDAGRTWSPPTTPHHDSTKTQHGFGSLFQAPGSGLGVIWLDGRATDPSAPGGANGSMGLWSAVYGADGREVSEASIDARVCECCQTSVAETAEGVIAAYRDRSAEEVRDIYVTRLVDGGWSAPAIVHADGWKIEGCPVNGPAVDARGRHVAVSWFTASANDGEAFIAFSDDAGRTFSRPIRVDDQACRGHVDVELLADGSAAVSWTESTEGHSQVKVRRVEPGGARSPAVSVARVSGTEYPRLAHGQGELLFTWSEIENGYSHVRTARAALPSR
jgi:hypothetical protein